MKFEVAEEHSLDFIIPDEWWLEAGMDSFVKKSSSYQPDRSIYESMGIEIIPLRLIFPQRRSAGIPDFQYARMLKILKGIRNDSLLPPVFLIESELDIEKLGYKFSLKDGFHRYRASVAAGFSHIPAVVWTD